MSTNPSSIDRAVQTMQSRGVVALLVGAGADLQHLTGYRPHPSERMTLLVLRDDGRHQLIVPVLERPAAEAASPTVPIASFAEAEDPAVLVGEALRGLDPTAPVGVGDQLWATFFLGILRVWPQAKWVPASVVTRHVRMVKDEQDIAKLRRAGAAIDAVHRQMTTLLRPNQTERQVGESIDAAMRAAGHDRSDFVIVASGPNGASPHHERSDRVIADGDPVVVDIGGPVHGWYSDCTRNYVVGDAPQGYHDAFSVLQTAQEAAVAKAGPGVEARSVDAAARDIITEAGYGDAFIHRTGHGIGLEVHEEPYITAENDLVLVPGMTFSIEPGIYLQGRFGMRIEDIVVVTDDGAERLNTTATDVVTIPA